MRSSESSRKGASAEGSSSDQTPAARGAKRSRKSPYKAAPRSDRNILETALTGPFRTLARAINAAGLADMLAERGPFTVFAPTDKAFSKMPKADLAALFENRPALTRLLMSHVVRNRVKGPGVNDPRSATTIHGTNLALTREPDCFRVNGTRILKTGIRASNGVLHAIDSVLLPR